MSKIKYILISLIALLLIGALYYQKSSRDDFSTDQIQTEKQHLTYESDWGISFKYTEEYKVMPMFLGNRYITLIPVDENSNKGKIIISFGENDENLTAEEWLLSEYSGFNQEYGYKKITIDEQEAVITDKNMWSVVNTPDNQTRLSIADLTTEGKERPYSQMDLLINSIIFK